MRGPWGGLEGGRQDWRNVMWGHSSAGTVQAKLLKTLIRFRKQTNCSSYQQSFILSARGMPLQRGLGKGRRWRHGRPPLTCHVECGRRVPFRPLKLRNAEQLSSSKKSQGGALLINEAARDLEAPSLTPQGLREVECKFPSFTYVLAP